MNEPCRLGVLLSAKSNQRRVFMMGDESIVGGDDRTDADVVGDGEETGSDVLGGEDRTDADLVSDGDETDSGVMGEADASDSEIMGPGD
jgi:hypothetical protein